MTLIEQLDELSQPFPDDHDEDTNYECPCCASPYAIVLGPLGRREHLRCRDCGIDYSREV